MEDHERNDQFEEGGTGAEGSALLSGSGGPRRGEEDIVFDFSKMSTLKVSDLAVMLTAHQIASEEERTVWVTGLPRDSWLIIRALGLEGYFRPFPYLASEEA